MLCRITLEPNRLPLVPLPGAATSASLGSSNTWVPGGRHMVLRCLPALNRLLLQNLVDPAR